MRKPDPVLNDPRLVCLHSPEEYYAMAQERLRVLRAQHCTLDEQLCAFMEPKPAREEYGVHSYQFWTPRTMLGHPDQFDDWYPIRLTFQLLWEIEDKLTDRQWTNYEDLLCFNHPQGCNTRRKIHARVDDKKKALAQAIGMPV
jgi:hypothetical protein